jgi:hypothetical protein
MEVEAAAEPPFKISAFVTTPAGHRIHKQQLVAMLNQCQRMSNDRLKRIEQEWSPGGRDGGGRVQRNSGFKPSVCELLQQETQKGSRIWIGRVQKMGRKVEKKTFEYQDPVHIDRIPDGCYVHCHWYGALNERNGARNKWLYGVNDANRYDMSAIKGVLKDRLTPARLGKDQATKHKR